MPSASIVAVPKLVIFHEVTAADLRKMRAESNDSDTGGGARDIRFPFAPFDQVFKEMLPNVRQELLVRGGERVQTNVHYGVAEFKRGTSAVRSEIAWYSPTDARPAEGRIPRVHQIAALSVPPRLDLGRPTLLFIQALGVPLTLAYAYEAELDQWDARLARVVGAALRTQGTAMGFVDLQDGREYIHD